MNEQDVLDRLREIADPDLGDDIVSLGLVNSVEITGDERVEVSLALGAPYSPNETAIASDVRETLTESGIDVTLSAAIATELSPEEQVLPDVQNIIAVASGKGGVGKSTVAVNLAAGLAERGASVGLFDADIYGPNVPRMVGSEEPPQTTGDQTLIPPERFGVKLMSMAYLVGEDDPVIWRGPMIDKIITQLLDDVQWGTLDYMILDLPPGTGDTQLTLLQSVPIAGSVIVTTPQEVAIDDARKGLRMFGEHETPVLGIVENMSSFRCPDCGSNHAIFGEGGGKRFAEAVEMPFLGKLPLDPNVRKRGDDGEPIVREEGETGEAFRSFADRVANNIGVIRRKQHSQSRGERTDQ